MLCANGSNQLLSQPKDLPEEHFTTGYSETSIWLLSVNKQYLWKRSMEGAGDGS